jgi:hypothetical protein
MFKCYLIKTFDSFLRVNVMPMNRHLMYTKIKMVSWLTFGG